jgi:hypothetical protein
MEEEDGKKLCIYVLNIYIQYVLLWIYRCSPEVELLTHNHEVVGSNPTLHTEREKWKKIIPLEKY